MRRCRPWSATASGRQTPQRHPGRVGSASLPFAMPRAPSGAPMPRASSAVMVPPTRVAQAGLRKAGTQRIGKREVRGRARLPPRRMAPPLPAARAPEVRPPPARPPSMCHLRKSSLPAIWLSGHSRGPQLKGAGPGRAGGRLAPNLCAASCVCGRSRPALTRHGLHLARLASRRDGGVTTFPSGPPRGRRIECSAATRGDLRRRAVE